MSDYRAKVALLQDQNEDQKLLQIAAQPKPKEPTARASSQKAILSSAVKRKSEGKATSEPQEKRVYKLQQPSALRLHAVLPGIGGNMIYKLQLICIIFIIILFRLQIVRRL